LVWSDFISLIVQVTPLIGIEKITSKTNRHFIRLMKKLGVLHYNVVLLQRWENKVIACKIFRSKRKKIKRAILIASISEGLCLIYWIMKNHVFASQWDFSWTFFLLHINDVIKKVLENISFLRAKYLWFFFCFVGQLHFFCCINWWHNVQGFNLQVIGKCVLLENMCINGNMKRGYNLQASVEH
jgi:hypothetical protein